MCFLEVYYLNCKVVSFVLRPLFQQDKLLVIHHQCHSCVWCLLCVKRFSFAQIVQKFQDLLTLHGHDRNCKYCIYFCTGKK